mmetsp:Transcript_7943/g.23939  ORF Transcript_7943/g.23939 Transcript_7943/m.23939 type:complete len:115 (-) Transcript_7943:2796-3140(-)
MLWICEFRARSASGWKSEPFGRGPQSTNKARRGRFSAACRGGVPALESSRREDGFVQALLVVVVDRSSATLELPAGVDPLFPFPSSTLQLRHEGGHKRKTAAVFSWPLDARLAT